MGVHPASARREAGDRRGVAVARAFPHGFLWGTASAAHQVEGGNRNNDWWEWEQKPGHIADGSSSAVACDHYHRYREDFALLRELNQNAHRMSIEWSRVEPSEGVFDAQEIQHYADVLGAIRDAGMTPMVTLHHFTSPSWFVRRGGWAARDAHRAFMPFVHKVVEELGDRVGIWCTVNEPSIYGFNGWMSGEFPPGRKGDLRGHIRVTWNMRIAHELAYRAIKTRWPDAPVGLSHHKFLVLSATKRRRDYFAAAVAQGFTDRWPAGGPRVSPIVEATADYIGIAHYWGQLAQLARSPGEMFIRRFNPPDERVTDFGFASRPSWMGDVLRSLKRYGKPVYVTENGIATTDDEWRRQYLAEILGQVHGAIADGVDVRGYFHWTNTDNFEWSRGYTAHFGLIAVDRQTLGRTVKPSGRMYARIAAANALQD